MFRILTDVTSAAAGQGCGRMFAYRLLASRRVGCDHSPANASQEENPIAGFVNPLLSAFTAEIATAAAMKMPRRIVFGRSEELSRTTLRRA